jgi:hypothetical protein
MIAVDISCFSYLGVVDTLELRTVAMTKRGTSDFKTFAPANWQFINNGLKICSCQVSGGPSLILSVY